MSLKNYITNLSDTKKSIQLLLDSFRKKISEKTSAVIQIDLSFPYPSPITTNPKILFYVIEQLDKLGFKEIAVIGGALPSVTAMKVWKMLGFDVLIAEKFPNVHFFPVGGNLITNSIHEIDFGQILFPKIVENAELFISIINPKISAISDVCLSIENSMHLVENLNFPSDNLKIEAEYCEKNLYYEKYKQYAIRIHQIRLPDLVLYDFSSILSKAGPLMYSDSNIICSNLFMLSESSIIGDYIALKMLGRNPNENPLINILKNEDYNLISQRVLEKVEIYLIEDIKNEMQIKEITSWLAETEKDNTHKISFWKRKGSRENNQLPNIDGLEPFIDILDCFSQKAEICKGIICSGCKQYASEFLLLLKTATHKDQEVIPPFSFLLGKNPIEPKNEYCVVFGDCAVQTTKDRPFRKKFVQKMVISEKDPDLERARLKIRLQKRLVELQAHEEFINLNVVDDTKKIQAIKRLKRKVKRIERMNTYRLKIYEIHSTHQENRISTSKNHQKFTLNKNILEISGCPPSYFNDLKHVIKLFRRRWTPGLVKTNNYIELCLNQNFPVLSPRNPNKETEIDN